MSLQVLPARPGDDAALLDLDRQCWSLSASVVPAPSPDARFFGPAESPADVLVAVSHAFVVGYVRLRVPTALSSNAHVQQVQGLGVHPQYRRQGVARALLFAAMELARSRGARKVSLRVLATNEPARQLYESVGFTMEGLLSDEFMLGGSYVNDVLMARFLDS
ncbi:MAG: GNAT family N-acetyltransferase [Mycobacteriales bacterium]